MTDHPHFESPPVVETVLSAQFTPLPGFSVAHAGWFWRDKLSNIWKQAKVQEAERVEDQVEPKDASRLFQGSSLRVRAGRDVGRLQIIDESRDRMVQVQNSRFAYNWRKRGGPYPSYEIIRPEFEQLFRRFADFVTENELGQLSCNLWEVTYVNDLPKGQLWKTPEDWRCIMPLLAGLGQPPSDSKLESLDASWHWVLGDHRARLHVLLRHAKIEDGTEVMRIQLITRGNTTGPDLDSLMKDLDYGHSRLVGAFLALTSELAHTTWGRQQ